MKTLNTSAKTYQKQNEINQYLTVTLIKINDFKGASKSGVELKSSDIKTKTIELGVQIKQQHHNGWKSISQ
ncbi:hypothetical protein J4727_12280 [Providencia rettgeri]|uniref:CdiA toxin EC869-like domain-containing protein n=1 Tax=Providencia rettgeri TaxID=587 RepID=A0A939NES5_PRORE|nr:hypothetical protein [Providencia rettgeri]